MCASEACVSCRLQVEVLEFLTPVQMDELVFSPPASPAGRTNILTHVFDFLLKAPNRDKLINFLPSLQTRARKVHNATI